MEDIYDVNSVICRVIMSDSILCPKYVIKKEIDSNKVNKNLLELIIHEKNAFNKFSELCYNKYVNSSNDLTYDPIHFKSNFWIRLILLSIKKNLDNNDNFVRVKHSCCRQNCIVIETIMKIVINELLNYN